MINRGEWNNAVGQWVRFRTPWGTHRGIVQEVNHRGVLVRVPQQYAPATLINASDEQKLDVALTAYGYPYGGYGYGYSPAARWGYPGWGGWYGGWWLWWLAFAWIFALAFLF
ncbi:hypothetical protein [Alicyclobacillus fodiniaquatilis]|uniref:Uncharacterized protein n=1 Tax=Alicyclobacillus fodiniaquatilis TaxID=1661150 RepID=A0ABW4JIW9_9BACL